MQEWQERLASFLESDTEWTGYIFMTTWNDLLPEIQEAAKSHLLVMTFLGTHAVIQTVAEKVFGYSDPEEATRFYLEHFVDKNEPERKYSTVAPEIHHIRNVMAHRAYSKAQHFTGYDWKLPGGFGWKGDQFHINPDRYVEDLVDGSGNYSKVRRKLVKAEDLLRRQYGFIRSWLELPRGDALHEKIKTFQKLANLDALRSAEPALKERSSRSMGSDHVAFSASDGSAASNGRDPICAFWSSVARVVRSAGSSRSV